MEAMAEAAKPLQKWMSDNCHPHTSIAVTVTDVDLYESVVHHVTLEFVKD
jgi:hypothetical protein